MLLAVLLEPFCSFLFSSTFLCFIQLLMPHVSHYWNLESFFLSRAGRSQVLFGMIISVHPGRYLLRVILHTEQHYSEVHYVYMDGYQSHERDCSHWNWSCWLISVISHWWNSTVSCSQGILLNGKKYSRCSLPAVQTGRPLLAQEDKQYKQVFLGFPGS